MTVEATELTSLEKARARGRAHYRKRAQDPEFREKHRQKARAYRDRHKHDEEFLARRRAGVMASYYRNKSKSEFREKKRAYEKARRSDPLRWPAYVLPGIRQRAKKSGLEFNLVPADLLVPALCPVLGIPLVIGRKNSPNSPSVDRFDNSKGYVKGNVRVISHRANMLKRDATLAEIERLAAYMRGEL
jgi:hypothetical protein